MSGRRIFCSFSGGESSAEMTLRVKQALRPGDGKQDVRNHLAFVAVGDALRHADIKWQHEEIDGPWRSRAIQAGTIWPLPNVWLGVSAEDQRRADERVPDLLATPAAVRFVSAEPLLGPIDFTRINYAHYPLAQLNALGCYYHCGPSTWDAPARLDWIIVGGESGPNARPMHPAWARSIRDQCAAAGVAYLFKQWGSWTRAPAVAGFEAGGSVLWPDGTNGHGSADRNGGPGVTMVRVGKKAAGRLLDGIEHNGMPEVRT